jgi:hypothetical protein
VQAYTSGERVGGEASLDGVNGEMRAPIRGWHPKDPLPAPASSAAAAASASSAAPRNRQKLVATLGKPGETGPASGNSTQATGSSGEGRQGPAAESSLRPTSPILALPAASATRRKAIMHQLPSFMNSRKEPPGGAEAASRQDIKDKQPAPTAGADAGAAAQALSPKESEVELLASLRYPARSLSPSRSSGVVIPRLIDRS